jgi:hypothetical protein
MFWTGQGLLRTARHARCPPRAFGALMHNANAAKQVEFQLTVAQRVKVELAEERLLEFCFSNCHFASPSSLRRIDTDIVMPNLGARARHARRSTRPCVNSARRFGRRQCCPEVASARARWSSVITAIRLISYPPALSVHSGLGMKPGTPVCTTGLNLMLVVMRSRMSRKASSGRGEIS